MMSHQQHQQIEMDASGFCVQYEDRPSGYTPHHWHKAMELALVEHGSVTCIFETSTSVHKAGDLMLINSYEVHQTRCSRRARYLSVYIDPSMMSRFMPTFQHLSFSLFHDPEDQAKAAAFQGLQERMKRLLELEQNRTGAAALEQQACLFGLAALLARHFSQPLAVEEPLVRQSDMARLEPILEYIQRHHGEDLQLDNAAKVMGLNKEYFCRLFKKNMGITHLQYIYQVRAVAVCRDLEYTDDPIGEIAERHGFHDSKTLNQYFKELYGCTPSEKRKMFREVSTEGADTEEDN